MRRDSPGFILRGVVHPSSGLCLLASNCLYIGSSVVGVFLDGSGRVLFASTLEVTAGALCMLAPLHPIASYRDPACAGSV